MEPEGSGPSGSIQIIPSGMFCGFVENLVVNIVEGNGSVRESSYYNGIRNRMFCLFLKNVEKRLNFHIERGAL